MNALLLIAMVSLAPLVLCYDEIYDKIDVDKIIADDDLFSSYIKCMLNEGPCDVEHSSEFKKPYEWGNEVERGEQVIHHTYLFHFFLELLPEVIATTCGKCTPIQKKHVKKTVKALGEKKPEDLMKFKKMYDPTGEHESTFTQFVLSPDE